MPDLKNDVGKAAVLIAIICSTCNGRMTVAKTKTEAIMLDRGLLICVVASVLVSYTGTIVDGVRLGAVTTMPLEYLSRECTLVMRCNRNLSSYSAN